MSNEVVTNMYVAALPGLPVGDWELKVTQTVGRGADDVLEKGGLEQTFHLHVGALPTRLCARDIHAVYPHDGATAVETGRIPHIVLRDRVLPWLGGEAGKPWLALLLLQVPPTGDALTIVDAGNKSSGSIVLGQTLGDLVGGVDDAAKAAAANLFARSKGSINLGEPASWLEVSPGVRDRYLPSDPKLLAHVRRVNPGSGEFRDDEDGFVSICIANRIVTGTGKNWMACLVSLRSEGEPGEKAGFVVPRSSPAVVRIPILHHWTFRSSDEKGDFESLVKGLRGGLIGRGVADPVGRVELAGASREGKPARFIYHPPLTPIRYDRPDDLGVRPWKEPLVQSEAALHLTVDASGRGLIGEVTWAAAFELGRLLALSDQEFLRLLIEHRAKARASHWEKVIFENLRDPLRDRLERGFRRGAGVLSELGLLDRVRDPLIRTSGPTGRELVNPGRFQGKKDDGIGLAEDPGRIERLRDRDEIRGLDRRDNGYLDKRGMTRPGRKEGRSVERPGTRLVDRLERDHLERRLTENPGATIAELSRELINLRGNK